MNIKEFINLNQELQTNLLNFIDGDSENDDAQFINFIESNNITEDRQEFNESILD